jgi:hypothetical protein
MQTHAMISPEKSTPIKCIHRCHPAPVFEMRDIEPLDAMNRDGEKCSKDGGHPAMATRESLADWLPKADGCHVIIRIMIAKSCRCRSPSLLLHDEP